MTRPIAITKIWIAALCAAGLVTAACGSSPASPSLVLSEASVLAGMPIGGRASSANASVTRLNFSVDLTVPAYPVCPFTPPGAGVITGTGVLTVVLRTITDGNGGTHIGSTIYGHGTATDANGDRWTWSDADLNNELFPSGNTSPNSFTQTVHEGFHVIGPKGQKIMVIGTFHLTTVNGTTVVEVEKGNHEEGEICESGFALTPLP